MSILEMLAYVVFRVIEGFGYAGIFLLMGISSSAIPIPSEVVMTFSAFGASRGIFYLPLVIGVGVLGSIMGSSFLYWLGRRGGRPLVERYGHLVWISSHRFEKLNKWFARFGVWAVFFGQMIPGVRAYIALPAGLTAIRWPRFILAAGSGALIWTSALSIIGFRLGKNWQDIAPLFRRFEMLVFVIMLVLVVGYIWLRIRNNR